MNEFRIINERLEKFMESEPSYDNWLLAQADAYYGGDGTCYEVTVRGCSYFDVKAKKPNGEIIELENIPLSVYSNIDVSDTDDNDRVYYPSWEYVCDNLEDYFDVTDLDNYDVDPPQVPEEKWLPEDLCLVGVKGFSKGHSLDDLELE